MTIELFFVERSNYQKAKNLVEVDDILSRQSFSFKEASSLGSDRDGFFLKISGTEESIKKAKEVLKDLAEIVEDKEQILKTIEEQENQADEGFGSLFG